jgi:hypothetical protein
MATRSQVLSMFGATPEQVRQAELQRQQDFLRSASGDPYQMAGGAIGLGLARLFGGKSEQLTRAEQLQERFKGIDVNSPEALREAAKGIADLAPEQALQIATYASQLERDQMAPIVNLPIQVGTKPKYMLNPLTQQYEQVGEEPIFREVPFERLPSGLKSLDPRYSLDMVDQGTLGKLNFPSDEAAAMVNAEIANMDYRQTNRDENGTIVGVTPQQEVAQPTLQITTEGTGTPVPPTAPITATTVTRPKVPVGQGGKPTKPPPAEDPLKQELAEINRRLVTRRNNPLTPDEKAALVARRKELRELIAQQAAESSTPKRRR